MADVVLNERRFRILLEMVNTATWVSRYHQHPGREDWHRAFESLSDELLSQAEKMGCGDLVEMDEESGRWTPCRDIEQESFSKECIDDMIEHTFWEELVGRLTDRDLWRSLGEQRWEQMSEDERQRVREKRDAYYWDAFEAKGIEPLELIPHGAGG